MRLGIDFGTTHTVVAVCDRGNYPVLSFTRPDGELTQTYPTLVAARGRQLRFGLEAEECVSKPGWTILRSCKRLLSGPHVALDTPVTVGGTETTVADLVTAFLGALRRDILEHSNVPAAPGRGYRIEAVIATPANARSPQRFITLEAFRRAGFEVVAVLDEPSASGIEYAHRYAGAFTAARQQVLVYDLGGGTFDASLVDMAGAEHRVVASAGIARLGGDDFDEALLELVLARQGRRPEDVAPAELNDLREACREQKERLHPNSRRLLVETESGAVEVLADDYYAAVQPLIDLTVETTDRVLAAAGSDANDLSGAYVVGGASALPPIGRTLRARFGRRYHRSAYPSASAAVGLAIAHDEDSPYRVTGRFARRLGVFREADAGAAVTFDEIVGEGLPIGGGAGEGPGVVRRYRASHNIGHYRFVEYDRVDDAGSPQGDLSPVAEVRFPYDPGLEHLRPHELARTAVERLPGDGPLVEERYSIGPAGEVQLEIVAVDSGYSRHYDLGAVSLAAESDPVDRPEHSHHAGPSAAG